MKDKIIEYGTTHNVTVLQATATMITVVDENNEGYFLIGHGIKKLPNVDDKGKITFVKNNLPHKGHWEYEKVGNPKA